jgi:hypothetical protein
MANRIGAFRMLPAVVILSTGICVDVAAQEPRITYEQFVRLSPDEQRSRFAALSVDTQAALKHRHAQRWLDNNRHTLTASQIALGISRCTYGYTCELRG